MNLIAWMKINRWNVNNMSKALGITAGYLSQIRRGRIPSLQLAMAIIRFTDGEVLLYDLGFGVEVKDENNRSL